DGLQAVAGIGQRAPDDDRHGVVEIRRAHLLLEPAGLDVAAGYDVGAGHQTSRVATRAFSSMNSRRGSTLSPISIVNRRSAAAASSIVTCASVRVVGSIVVARSCSAFISPRPLKRCIFTPLA